ncbi:hypothetical protein GCM10022420_065760 [Streptomyces iranensis]
MSKTTASAMRTPDLPAEDVWLAGHGGVRAPGGVRRVVAPGGVRHSEINSHSVSCHGFYVRNKHGRM